MISKKGLIKVGLGCAAALALTIAGSIGLRESVLSRINQSQKELPSQRYIDFIVNVNGYTKEDINVMKKFLNMYRGCNLNTNGVYDSAMMDEVWDFQYKKTNQDGLVGRHTLSAMVAECSDHPKKEFENAYNQLKVLSDQRNWGHSDDSSDNYF